MTRLLFLLAFFVAAPAAAQQDLSKVEIQAHKLSDSVYMLIGAGGNMGLSVGEDVFLIDDQFAPLTERIEAAIRKLTPKPIKFVLNTHWHFDHTGGNENLGKAGALIVAHDNVRKRMSVEGFIEFLGMRFKAEPRQALPVVTFTRDVSFHLNGDEIYVYHAPNAHTDGDAIVHFRKSDVFHMGDTFFNRLYPFIDTSSGGSVEGVIAAADRVLQLAGEGTRIIPGHGPLASRAELRAGRSLAQVLESGPSAEFDAHWGRGFLNPQRFVEMLYQNLQQAK